MKARRISFGSDVGYGIGGEKEEEWKGMALEDPMTCGGVWHEGEPDKARAKWRDACG